MVSNLVYAQLISPFLMCNCGDMPRRKKQD